MSIPDLYAARILIADDQEMNVTVLSMILATAGYRDVSVTTDAREVAALQRRHNYDLIVLDLHMPHLSGFEVLARLKEADPKGCPPVLVVTAASEHMLRALSAGARDFVCKPYEAPEMLSRIRDILEARLPRGASRGEVPATAHYDALTGLPDRQLFQRMLEQSLQASWPRLCAVVVADIDGFSGVNKAHGRAAGDEVLRQAAARLGQWIPEGSATGRLGSDEFAVVLTALDSLHAVSQLAGQIREAMAVPFLLQEDEVCLSASIGIAVYPGDSCDAGVLLSYAGTALDLAKREGGGSYRFFTDAMKAGPRQRFGATA